MFYQKRVSFIKKWVTWSYYHSISNWNKKQWNPWFWSPFEEFHMDISPQLRACKWFRWWPPEFHWKSLWWCFGDTTSGFSRCQRTRTLSGPIKGTWASLGELFWCFWKQVRSKSKHLNKGSQLNNDHCRSLPWVSPKPPFFSPQKRNCAMRVLPGTFVSWTRSESPLHFTVLYVV